MRAQVAFEFITYVIMAVSITVLFLVLTYAYSQQAIDDKRISEIDDFAKSIQQEIILAAQAESGYHRIINLPMSIDSGSYSITNDEQSFTITSSQGESIIRDTPQIQGTLQKGDNIFTQYNGTVIIS